MTKFAITLQSVLKMAEALDLLDHPQVQKMISAAVSSDDYAFLALIAAKLTPLYLQLLAKPYPFKHPKDVTGEINIGKTVNEGNFGLSLEELSRHILVAGSSGSGKTNLNYWIIKQLLEEQ